MAKYKLNRESVSQSNDPSIRFIPLTNGHVAIVDASDYEWLSQWNWYATKRKSGKVYAARNVWVNGMRMPSIYMHKAILCTSEHEEVDHRDNDGLNNRRDNLRQCVHVSNARNSPRHRDSTSPYKGISFHKGARRWQAGIGVNGKRIGLGLFDMPEEAARAYDLAAVKYFGEFARLNFPHKAA